MRPAHCTSPCRRYLESPDVDRSQAIHTAMADHQNLVPAIAVSTVLHMWNARRKVAAVFFVGAVDLRADIMVQTAGARPSENTIVERIPPRLAAAPGAAGNAPWHHDAVDIAACGVVSRLRKRRRWKNCTTRS